MIRCGQRMQNIATVVIDEVQMLEDPTGPRLDGLVAGSSTSPRRHSSCISPPPSDHQRRSRKNSTASSSGTTTGRSRSNAISFHGAQAENPDNQEADYRGIHEHVLERVPGPDDHLHQRPRPVPHDCRCARDACGGLPRRALQPGAPRGRDQVPGRQADGGRDHSSARGRGRFPRVAGHLRCPRDGPGLALCTGVQPDGRPAGRPDFHDLGKVVLLAEPGGSYSRENPYTEEEVANTPLKGRWKRSLPSTTLNRVRRNTWQMRLPAGARKRTLPGSTR